MKRLLAKFRSKKIRHERLTQWYTALNQCNQAIIRSTNADELFQQVCHRVVNSGAMQMAWIGRYVEQQVEPVVWYGEGKDYFDAIFASPSGEWFPDWGGVGIALREDRAHWYHDLRNDPLGLGCREQAFGKDWEVAVCMPLHLEQQLTGVIVLYGSDGDALDGAARESLEEMARNIDVALSNFKRETVRQGMDSELSQSVRLLRSVIDNVPLRVFWKDRNSRYLGCNPIFAQDAGLVSTEMIVGKSDLDLCWKDQAENYQADDSEVMSSRQAKLFFVEEQTTPDGRTIYLRTSKVPLIDESGNAIGVLGLYEDITEKKKVEQQIHYLANFDPLTGLPNRGQLDEHLRYALSLAKRNNGHLALMFLDLDHFKDINDTLGHSVGDAVLIELANRLRLLLREEDTITRMGGDEFIFLLPGTNAHGAAKVAEKLLEVIALPFNIQPYELSLTASIGIAIYPDDGVELERLSQSADAAMYHAKQEGRQNYQFFTQEMHARSVRNLQLVNALRHAQEFKQLQICYQPQVDVNSGRIVGAEALLRWRHPMLGSVPPSEFIPVAEDNGLVLSIGQWVLQKAIRQAKEWRQQGLPSLSIAVNLSAVQFRHPDLLNMVESVLQQESIPFEMLELELTESVAMHNPQAAIAVMRKFYELGIRIAIDDFGTGYSSLSYLKQFKTSKLKIDKSFVSDIMVDPEDRVIVAAIIGLAKSLGLQTLAEGVEDESQLDFLRLQGCDQYQGYCFSAALTAEQFVLLFDERETNCI